MILYAGKTDTGMVRQNNEDSFAFLRLEDGRILAVVADGMGGHNAGEVASSTAVKSALAYIESHSSADSETLIVNALKTANYDIFRASSGNPELFNMGTTVTAAVISDTEIVFANVGDSRGYLYHGELEQVTTDHSYVQQLVNEGFITQQEAEDHPQKNYITRALGFDEAVAVDVFHRVWQPGDRILLCSDGLVRHVAFEEIGKILSGLHTPEYAGDAFVKLALARGGTDNVTVAVIYNNEEEA
ncbi:MAG: Stp1/IreP family PP2C-type Ser/Thr phosphatase [Eubacteriales bacterium]|nr:Stp1/IreP family PP2C-type Ser/Thr phosphatase [Eubacteriales bacterium]